MTNIPANQSRRQFTKYEWATLALKTNGKCGNCGVKLDFRAYQVYVEHLNPLANGGTNDLDNLELWCMNCKKAKDAKDKARIAKNARLRGETGQVKRRKQRGSSMIKNRNQWPPKGSQKFPKRKSAS